MRLRDDLKPVLVFFAIFVCNQALAEPQIDAIDAIGITVSDVTRSLAFYTEVLPFREVARSEVTGDTYERLTGVSGLRMQVVRLQLGDEFIELIEYLAPRGRPMPTDAHSNDMQTELDSAFSGRAWAPRTKAIPS